MTDTLPPDVAAAALKTEPPPPTGLEEAHKALIPLADGIRLTLSSIALIPLHTATPEQRSQIVALRAEIERVARDSSTWLDAIDLSFRHAAQQMGAREIPLADGVVRVDPVRDDVRVDATALKAELLEASKAGLSISREEIESIFTTEVELKADGSKLNYFSRNRGDELHEIIERHRRRTPGNPLSAKLRFVRRAE